MASSRLPGKPLADIAGLPMIVQVWKRACEADIGEVLVAAAEAEICAAITEAGGRAVLTDPDLPSGSDRSAAALALEDPERKYEFIVNLQGDLPAIDPAAISASLSPFASYDADITTLATKIDDEEEITNPSVVKAITSFEGNQPTALATDFQRILDADIKPPFWHHIGIYAYRRAALEKFVSLPVSKREAERSLEQMRALDNGMLIAITAIDTIPFGVDTPQDLERARKILES